jgi:ribosomal protein L29
MEAKGMREQIAENRKALFTLKMNMLAGQVKDVSQFKKLRKEIARAMTQMNASEASTDQKVSS